MSAPAVPANILDNLKTAILLVDAELKVKYLNAAAEALLDVSGSRVIGEPLSSLFTEIDDGTSSLIMGMSLCDTFTKRETKLQLNNRDIITVDCAVTPINENDLSIGMIIELQPLDLLLRISREKALLASQENTDSLIRGMAHEIKNPLGGLRGAAQLLAKQLPSSELNDYTDIIIKEADRLRNLVDRMLGSNALLNLQAVNIHEILEHVKRLIEAETEQQISILRDYDPSTPDITGDKEQLIQALLNIARNAMQALQLDQTEMPSICFRTRVLRQFTIGSDRHRLVCHVAIIDNGPGIAESLLSRIFLPMVSGHPSGTGLGLSLAQSIINHHKGLIECQSQNGKTVFSIYIPITPSAAQEKRNEP